MNAFLPYLRYRLKKSSVRNICLAAIAATLLLNFSFLFLPTPIEEFQGSNIEILALLLAIAATLIPILETAEMKNRRNLDTLFFFPISRKKMAIAHYLSGLFQLFFVYTVSFLLFFLLLLLGKNGFALGYMVPFYFLSLLCGILIYSVVLFLFSEGNTVVDGVIFTALWVFAGALVSLAINENFYFLLTPHRGLITTGWTTLYSPIYNVTSIFDYLLAASRNSEAVAPLIVRRSHFITILAKSYWFVLWGALGVGAVLGYIRAFVRRDAYTAGDISHSVFGYKILIPIYGYSLLFMNGFGLSSVFFFIAMFLGYVIYRRGFRLSTSDMVVLACGLFPMMISFLFFQDLSVS